MRLPDPIVVRCLAGREPFPGAWLSLTLEGVEDGNEDGALLCVRAEPRRRAPAGASRGRACPGAATSSRWSGSTTATSSSAGAAAAGWRWPAPTSSAPVPAHLRQAAAAGRRTPTGSPRRGRSASCSSTKASVSRSRSRPSCRRDRTREHEGGAVATGCPSTCTSRCSSSSASSPGASCWIWSVWARSARKRARSWSARSSNTAPLRSSLPTSPCFSPPRARTVAAPGRSRFRSGRGRKGPSDLSIWIRARELEAGLKLELRGAAIPAENL